MSNIDYSVWGSPETWWDIPDLVGFTPTNAPFCNIRYGAADWSDSDFDEYPTFTYSNSGILRNSVVNGYISLNSALDDSIAYTAIANPDLPQRNVYIFDKDHKTISDYSAKLISSDPLPFALSQYYRGTQGVDCPAKNGIIYGFDGFPNEATVFAAQGMQRILPFASYDTSFINTWGYYNPNLRVTPFTSFGIKSLILEINVRYITTGTTTATTNLKNYLNNTPTWLNEHKIVSAWCDVYVRTLKSGQYTKTAPAAPVTIRTDYRTVSPLFFGKYECSGFDIQNITGSGYGDSYGCFPIFGQIMNNSFATGLSVNSELQSNPSQTAVGSRTLIYGADKGELHTAVNNYSLTAYMTLDLSIEDNVEYIMKGAAAYGLFFCQDIGTLGNAGRDTGATERWLDSEMYLGIIRSDGMTYGEYSQGEGNKDQQQYGWKDSTETPYVPGQSTNIYSNQTRIRSVGKIDTMCDRYVLNDIAVNALSVDLFTIMSDLSLNQTEWSELIAKTLDNFLVQNPVDCIVSLKKYPVKTIPNTGELTNIRYGRYSQGSAAGYPCEADVYTYAFTPRRIRPRFGNSYLDYEPFTSAEIYIPYCGSITLKMCDILDKQLEPFLCVDYHTGQCTGFVMCDGIVIETIQGTIAIDVPITGIQTATVESQLMQSANAARSVRVNQAYGAFEGVTHIAVGVVGGAKFGGVGGAVSGAATGAVGALKNQANLQMQQYQADYDLTHQAAPQHIIGSSSSACGWIIDSDTARLILYYPTGGVIDDANPPNFREYELSEFGSIYGFSTLESGTLGSYSGFTTATQMQLEGITTANGEPATEQELELIRSAIAEGIII